MNECFQHEERVLLVLLFLARVFGFEQASGPRVAQPFPADGDKEVICFLGGQGQRAGEPVLTPEFFEIFHVLARVFDDPIAQRRGHGETGGSCVRVEQREHDPGERLRGL